MFRALGILVALYALYAAMSGKVYVKAGPWGKTVTREAAPVHFWVALAIYAGLAAMLVLVF